MVLDKRTGGLSGRFLWVLRSVTPQWGWKGLELDSDVVFQQNLHSEEGPGAAAGEVPSPPRQPGGWWLWVTQSWVPGPLVSEVAFFSKTKSRQWRPFQASQPSLALTSDLV